MKITQEAKVPGLYPEGMKLAQTWFDMRCITNLLSSKELVKVFHITYVSEEATAFTIHNSVYGLVDLHFVMHPSGLHVLEINKGGHFFVQTVEDNIKLFTRRQIAGATESRNVYKLLHCPLQADINNIICLGSIKGFQVTLENVDVARKIWGPSVIIAKGNTVRRNAKL